MKLGLISKYRSVLYGVTILWIVVFHSYESFGEYLYDVPGNFNDILRLGNLGVDLFLFLSGISMYYAMTSNIKRGGNISSFYKKRVWKIARIYLFFSIPFFCFLRITDFINTELFIRHIFFANAHLNSFWFLLCIVICYLIYPLLYKLIESNKSHIIYFIIVGYIIFLLVFFLENESAYCYDEVLLTRLPVFMFGSIMGKKVYNNEQVKPYKLAIAILLLFARGPFFYGLNHMIDDPSIVNVIGSRLFGSVQAVAAVFVLTMLLNYLENSRINNFFAWVGGFTLEIYVFHVAFICIILEYTPFVPTNTKTAILWTIVFVILSLLGGYVLHKAFQHHMKKE